MWKVIWWKIFIHISILLLAWFLYRLQGWKLLSQNFKSIIPLLCTIRCSCHSNSWSSWRLTCVFPPWKNFPWCTKISCFLEWIFFHIFLLCILSPTIPSPLFSLISHSETPLFRCWPSCTLFFPFSTLYLLIFSKKCVCSTPTRLPVNSTGFLLLPLFQFVHLVISVSLYVSGETD